MTHTSHGTMHGSYVSAAGPGFGKSRSGAAGASRTTKFSTLTHQACRHSFFAMDRKHDPPPQACCSCSRPWGGVTHPTTLSRQHGAPTMCPHRAIISRAGGWAFEHGEPSSHKLHTALRCMLWVCEVFGACTGRAGIPTLTHQACRHSFFAMDRTHDPPPQACCSCSRPWGGVTHPTAR